MVQTICALSTPRGRSALAIIRISGPKSLDVSREMGADDLTPRQSKLCVLKDHAGLEMDEPLVTYFQAPNSYTGEDVVEITTHGNPIIVDKIVSEIVSRETVRLAEPGEFTSRALANKKLSLDQVESLDWILNSTNIEGVRRGLQAKLQGLGSSTSEVSSGFMDLIASLQSQLDFSADEVGVEDRSELLCQVDGLISRLDGWAKNFETSKYLFSKWVVVLAGPPNSGKSSLFNRLIGMDKAIVFDQPGTTRDFIEHSLVIDGVDILLIDTAGIRDNPEAIEKIGIEKTKNALFGADVICWVDDEGRRPDPNLLSEYSSKRWVFLHSKADLAKTPIGLGVSVFTGDGVNRVKGQILPDKVEATALVPLTSERQRALVESAVGHLKAARLDLAAGQYLDMVTEQMLMGARAIRAIVEPPESESVLKQIFSRFCIGK